MEAMSDIYGSFSYIRKEKNGKSVSAAKINEKNGK